ncbi:MAG: hypothetical protein ACE5GI_05460 [Candidatus Aminicenantales bacterium]
MKDKSTSFFGYKLHASVILSNFPPLTSVEITSGKAYEGRFFKTLFISLI